MSARRAKKASLEDRLRALGEVRTDPSAPETAERLREALAARESFLVARAAALAGELQLSSLAPDLEKSLEHWLVPDPKRDPGCRAKVALARALNDLDRHPVELFTAGMRLIQREPGFGAPSDTADELSSARWAWRARGKWMRRSASFRCCWTRAHLPGAELLMRSEPVASSRQRACCASKRCSATRSPK
jgi:hypothetical protein